MVSDIFVQLNVFAGVSVIHISTDLKSGVMPLFKGQYS